MTRSYLDSQCFFLCPGTGHVGHQFIWSHCYCFPYTLFATLTLACSGVGDKAQLSPHPRAHDHSLVFTARHSTSTSWRSDAPIILPGWEYHTRGSWLTSTVPKCLYGGRLWMALTDCTKVHAATAHSNMVAEQFIRSAAFRQSAELTNPEGRTSNSGS